MQQSNTKFKTLPIGLAMFSMFFGAGNIIFPLALGQYAGDKNHFAILGLIFTAVVMPFAGLIAMILYEGDYRRFFGRIGKIPGFLLALMSITLLGPLGSTPRCVALSYSTLNVAFPGISPMLFNGFACVLIFLFTFRRNCILSLLGYLLTPILLGSLAIIIILGLTVAPEVRSIEDSFATLFFHGLKEGYNTMDLMAAFFFSSIVLTATTTGGTHKDNKTTIRHILKASLIGAFLLASTYMGLSQLASFHAGALGSSSSDQLLGTIAIKIIGPFAGWMVCIAVALACLTTAIALSSVFSAFLQKDVFNEKISYRTALIGSLTVTFIVASFEFSGISAFLTPILQVCYPAMIMLTCLNIAHRLWNFNTVKIPVALTFVGSLIAYVA